MCPVILQSFERNTYSGSRYIRLFNFWSWAQIIHLPQKKTFFVYLSCPIILQSFQKSATADLRCSLRFFFFWKLGRKIDTLLQKGIFWKISLIWLLSTYDTLLSCKVLENCPFATKENFKNLQLCDFVLWRIMRQSFQKFIRADLEILACIIFGKSWTKIGTFPQRNFFFQISLMWLSSSYYVLLCCKVSENSLELILR